MTIPQLPDNTALLNAMREVAASDNPESRQRVYETMLGSTFLIPAYGDTPGQLTIEPGQNVQLMTLQAQDGQAAWAFFTDLDALLAWNPEGISYYVLRAVELFRLAVRNQVDHVVINLAGPVGGRINAWEIQALARGTMPTPQENVIHETPIMIGTPDDDEMLPHELVARVTHILTKTDAVLAGYLFMLAINDRPAQLVLGLRLAAQELSDQEAVMTVLSDQIAANVKADSPLGMLIIPDDLLPLIDDKAVQIFKR